MKKLYFVFNALAGKAQIKNHLLDIVNKFVEGGYEVTVRPTQAKLDAYESVKSHAADYDLIVCSGGDGTLNEVVKGLMECENPPKLGYIPAGTTNDFATSMQIPKNMLKAADAIINGDEFACDIGSFNGDNFTYISAFGAFTDVAYETSQQAKNIIGHLAYVLEGIKRLGSIKSYHIKVTHDGEMIEDDFVFGMVSNSMSVGGFKGFGEGNIVLDDGFFEVALIKMPKNPIDLQITINHLLKYEINSKFIYYFKAAQLEFSSDEDVSWTLDGEFGGLVKDVIVKNNKHAITFLRPKNLK